MANVHLYKLKKDAYGFIDGKLFDGTGNKGPMQVELSDDQYKRYQHMIQEEELSKKEKK